MSSERINKMRGLEGRQVTVALRDGSRIDDCQLVSAGRAGARSVWVFTQGTDRFVPASDVIDAWEVRTVSRQAA
ncbi:MAG: hypothetical protein ACRDQ2_01580 [Gaiellales bacterium]